MTATWSVGRRRGASAERPTIIRNSMFTSEGSPEPSACPSPRDLDPTRSYKQDAIFIPPPGSRSRPPPNLTSSTEIDVVTPSSPSLSSLDVDEITRDRDRLKLQLEQLQSNWKAEKVRLLISHQKNDMLNVAKISQLESQIQQLGDKSTYENKIEKLEKKLSKLKKAAQQVSTLEGELQKNQERVLELEKILKDQEEAHEAQSESIKKQQQEVIEAESQERKEMEAKICRLERELEEKSKQIEYQKDLGEQNLKILESEKNCARDRVQELEKALEEQSQRFEEAIQKKQASENDEKDERIHLLEEELKAAKGGENSLAREISGLAQDKEMLESTKQQLFEELQKATQQNQHLTEVLTEKTHEYNAVLRSKIAELEHVKTEQMITNSKIARLEGELVMAQQSGSQGNDLASEVERLTQELETTRENCTQELERFQQTSHKLKAASDANAQMMQLIQSQNTQLEEKGATIAQLQSEVLKSAEASKQELIEKNLLAEKEAEYSEKINHLEAEVRSERAKVELLEKEVLQSKITKEQEVTDDTGDNSQLRIYEREIEKLKKEVKECQEKTVADGKKVVEQYTLQLDLVMKGKEELEKQTREKDQENQRQIKSLREELLFTKSELASISDKEGTEKEKMCREFRERIQGEERKISSLKERIQLLEEKNKRGASCRRNGAITKE
eukprot:TRINITY_DN4645_c0_g1_i2.p1 TRINITY_DN4645_c0_g1~~TRINITY_DN4645_c0_g1_i2.p1  ORF type:complete len:787 (-),score=223.91 TRINITY_DN4645_c0_g1_i2:2646-4679(-)